MDLVLQANERGSIITIIATGHTQIANGITYSRFETVPDAPVTSMELNLPEGRYSILGAPTANGSLCGSALTMPTTLVGQNGAQIEENVQIQPEGCPGALSIRSHRLKKHTLTLSLYVPAAGTVQVSGAGIQTKTTRLAASRIITLKIHEKNARRRKLKTKVHVSFTPKAGKTRNRQTKTFVVKFPR